VKFSKQNNVTGNMLSDNKVSSDDNRKCYQLIPYSASADKTMFSEKFDS
jgi:hypothetical protein